MSFILKAYDVQVEGWPWMRFFGASAGRARARCWRSYSSIIKDISFRDFLRISSIRPAVAPKEFGEKVKIGGRPAYLVTGAENAGGHVAFVYDDTDDILFSHPLDVAR